jgi:preprotein translocase subunit SecF
VDYRRVEVVGPRVSSELLAKSTIGLGLAIFAILIYSGSVSNGSSRSAP